MFLKAGGAGAEVKENLNNPIIEDITAEEAIENQYQVLPDAPGPAGGAGKGCTPGLQNRPLLQEQESQCAQQSREESREKISVMASSMTVTRGKPRRPGIDTTRIDTTLL